jgi:chromosome segregation ATPase
MTTVSKVLTVLVFIASVAFMAFAATSSATRTDWKTRVAEYPEKIAAQRKKIEQLDQDIVRWDARLQDARKSEQADLVAMNRREAALVSQLQQLHAQASALSAQIDTEAKAVQAKREEARLRREEVFRLRNQLEELRTQNDSAVGESKRLKDLLVQAQGVLERAERRMQLLEADGAKLPDSGKTGPGSKPQPEYDPPATGDSSAPSKPALPPE